MGRPVPFGHGGSAGPSRSADERPSSNRSGTARTAYGEFVGAHGELASYAFGWSTAEVTGRFTVGIGAGNPGGGSFHAEVVPHSGDCGLVLVDEPFAVVPQGGPDLRREVALAHEDLPFVWHVTDEVLARDPRAWWLRHWLLGTRAIATRQVLDGEEPVLQLMNDDDDDLWQAIGSSAPRIDGGLLHLSHLIDEDPTLVPVLDLEPGEWAERSAVGAAWSRHPAPPVDGPAGGATHRRRRPRRPRWGH